MKAIRALAGVALALPIWVAPANAQTPPDERAEIVDFDFDPRELQVEVGTTVSWTNRGARPHTVTDRGGTFDELVAPGGDAQVSFSVPGRFYFFCRINPGRMNGTIVVNPGSEPARVNRIQATDDARQGDTFRFDPDALTVESGSTIVFANVGGKPHTLTAEDGSFDTGVVGPGPGGGKFAGNNASITVARPGTFAFRCDVHPAVMRGTLTVVGEAQDAPPPASEAATAANLSIRDFSFEPAEVSIAPGGRVTWTNEGDAGHTATFDDVPLDTGAMESGRSSTLEAPLEPGSYSYFCSIHPARMRGVLVIVGQNVEDPVNRDPEPPDQVVGGGGGALSAAALGTGVVGAFFAGIGVGGFLLRRRVARRRVDEVPVPGQEARSAAEAAPSAHETGSAEAAAPPEEQRGPSEEPGDRPAPP